MEQGLSPTKRLIFWMIAVLLVIAALEVFSLVICRRFIPSRIAGRTAYRSAEDYIAAFKRARGERIRRAEGRNDPGREKDRERLRMFHRVLGWDYPPSVEYKDVNGIRYSHGPWGERRTCTSFRTNLIATFGDSFTYCSDVEDCRTWQTYLAKELRANVLNFGVAGYGTDQAYLKYEMNAPGISTPIVMLGILPDDINRVVNIFRTFYAPQGSLALTKPRYVQSGRGFRLVKNPVDRADDAKKLEDTEFVRKLGDMDYWFKKDMNRPRLGFPYLVSVIQWRKTLLQHLIFDLGLAREGSTGPFYPGNLFEEREPFEIMCHIVDLFVKTATARGAKPIIILMPHRELIAETLRHGVSRADSLARYLELKRYLFIDLIRAMARMRPTEDQLNEWYLEHATPEGNRITARIIAEYLRKKDLLPVNTTFHGPRFAGHGS